MAEDKVYLLTQEAYNKMKEELAHREGELREEIAHKIAVARAEGDLSENGGYQAAREAQSKNEGRITELTGKLTLRAGTSADLLAAATGVPIAFEQVSEEAAVAALEPSAGRETAEFLVHTILGFLRDVEPAPSGVVEEVTGRPGTTVAAWAQAHADQIRAEMRRLFEGDTRLLDAEIDVLTRSGERRQWSFSASAPSTWSATGRHGMKAMPSAVQWSSTSSASRRARL